MMPMQNMYPPVFTGPRATSHRQHNLMIRFEIFFIYYNFFFLFSSLFFVVSFFVVDLDDKIFSILVFSFLVCSSCLLFFVCFITFSIISIISHTCSRTSDVAQKKCFQRGETVEKYIFRKRNKRES